VVKDYDEAVAAALAALGAGDEPGQDMEGFRRRVRRLHADPAEAARVDALAAEAGQDPGAAPPGAVLSGRYELRRLLGGGATGTAWEAYDNVLERRVAAKALVPEGGYGADLQVTRERMRREALALALVDHPAVVTVHDLAYHGEDPWIVTGYVDGPTLAQYVADNPRLPEPEVASIGLAVLQGLLACHAKDLYHRDVKPQNVIRTPEGSARLIDFGIARAVGTSTLTAAGEGLGTPEYMAPELFRDQAASQRTDLWALGATLYYALEGRSPFAMPTIHATIGALLGDGPPSPPRRPGPLADLVLRMLRKQPRARPDAAAVLGELRAIAGSGAPARRRDMQTAAARAAYPENRAPLPARPLTQLSGRPAVEAARIIAGLTPGQAVTELLALEDEEAARILLECDGALAGQLLDSMTPAAAAAALALPPARVAARVLARAGDPAVGAVLSELSRTRPDGGAPLFLALYDLQAGRAARVLATLEPAVLARLLRNVSPPDRREGLLGRLPLQLRPLAEKRLADGEP
jgi:hypothetical protein